MSKDASQIADQISQEVEDTEKRLEILRELSVPKQCAVFNMLSPYVQQLVIEGMDTLEIVDLLDHMDLQQANQAMAKISDAKKRSTIVKRLKGAVKEKLDYFLRFHPKASLDLITFNYIFLSEKRTVEYAADKVDQHYDETGKYPEILVHKKLT